MSVRRAVALVSDDTRAHATQPTNAKRSMGVGGIAEPTTPRDDPAESSTRPKYQLSLGRIKARAIASRLIGVAVTGTSSFRRVAHSLGVTDSRVGDWANPEHDAAMTLGDILAAGITGQRAFAKTVLVAALGALEDGDVAAANIPLPTHLMRLQMLLGGLSGHALEALRDGKITRDEQVNLLAALKPLMAELESTQRDIALVKES